VQLQIFNEANVKHCAVPEFNSHDLEKKRTLITCKVTEVIKAELLPHFGGKEKTVELGDTHNF